MKSGKVSAAEAPANRRSQPVRQTRTNPPRSSLSSARSAAAAARDSATSNGPAGSQPIDTFPAITHFADAITALPKELVRHFTLLKEVDAKLFAPEDQLCKLVAAANKASSSEHRKSHDTSSLVMSAAASVAAQSSSAGLPASQVAHSTTTADDASVNATTSGVFDPSNIPRRQLFRQTALKIQEMLVSLEEKNHVISTANEALQRQLARVDDVWPYLESEFSDEAKWGSTTHWAYPENRSNGKASHTERARRDGAAAISAAAQALADEVAARSDARKQAVQAKRNQRNQHQDSEADDHDGRQKGESSKKASSSKARKVADNHVGLGISATSNTNGNPPQKRRKVEKPPSGASGGVAIERAPSGALGSNAPQGKTNSPRGTPMPEGPKKRKALPSGGGGQKKKNGAPRTTPPATSSPVLSGLPEPSKARGPPSPNLGSIPRPASSRARKDSLQSNNAEIGKGKGSTAAPGKPNGHGSTPADLPAAGQFSRPGVDHRSTKETSAPAKSETTKHERDRVESGQEPATSTAAKKESKGEEAERKSEPRLPPPLQLVATVTTKSGRASKPSTPALANAQELARPRSSRNTDGGGSKKSQKKGNATPATSAPQAAAAGTSGNAAGEDEDEIDADEPTYCYCNSVSYGEMVACDAPGCEIEWFHLACVGLKVAPGSRTKWYCEDCKERLGMVGRKTHSR